MKIGLMYASDYGYGASLEKWTTGLYEENYGTDNWLYLGSDEWLISRVSNNSSSAFYVSSTNGGSFSVILVYGSRAIRPSFYLAPTVEFSGGTGTQSDPFTLSIN